jgi:hypothetical protein
MTFSHKESSARLTASTTEVGDVVAVEGHAVHMLQVLIKPVAEVACEVEAQIGVLRPWQLVVVCVPIPVAAAAAAGEGEVDSPLKLIFGIVVDAHASGAGR